MPCTHYLLYLSCGGKHSLSQNQRTAPHLCASLLDPDWYGLQTELMGSAIGVGFPSSRRPGLDFTGSLTSILWFVCSTINVALAGTTSFTLAIALDLGDEWHQPGRWIASDTPAISSGPLLCSVTYLLWLWTSRLALLVFSTVTWC